VNTKNTTPTAALAAKIGTCAPGSLASAGKNWYTRPATYYNPGVMTGIWFSAAM
jgi:hypothetical protein